MKKPINEIARMKRIAGIITESQYKEAIETSDLEVKWTPVYTQDPDKYYEKGLADDFETINGKKVKEIVGYYEDENGDEDFDIIGHIISKSGKDIETEYDIDDLDDVFMDALSKSNLQELNPDQMAGIAGAATGAAGILAAATAALKQEYNKIIKNNPEISKTDAIKQALMNAGKSLKAQFGGLSEDENQDESVNLPIQGELIGDEFHVDFDDMGNLWYQEFLDQYGVEHDDENDDHYDKFDKVQTDTIKDIKDKLAQMYKKPIKIVFDY
jgi:hypothetical protein